MGTYNKIIYGGRTLIDLTGDTVNAYNLLSGATAHCANGFQVTGMCKFDMDTSDMTATAYEILEGKTAGVKGNTVTGTMKNNGEVKGYISGDAIMYRIPAGYHDGSGSVSIAATEWQKLIGENIRSGITILGVTGTMSGTEDVIAQTKTATPTVDGLTITPDSGYNYLAQVNIGPIPYVETENSAGGITVTIANP